MQEPSLRAVAHPALERFAEITGESAQLYVRDRSTGGSASTASSRRHELRTFVDRGRACPSGQARQGRSSWRGRHPAEQPRARARATTPATPLEGQLRQEPATARPWLGIKRRGAGRRRGIGQRACARCRHDELIASVSISGPDLACPADRREAPRARGHGRRTRDRGRPRRGAGLTRSRKLERTCLALRLCNARWTAGSRAGGRSSHRSRRSARWR